MLGLLGERVGHYALYVAMLVLLQIKRAFSPKLSIACLEIFEKYNRKTLLVDLWMAPNDFADPSSKEDPVQQTIRYVNQVREGKFKTPTGRDILVNDTTPFYGYVVCDLIKKVKDWLQKEKNFTPMPDGLGWFSWFGNISLYMEVVSWTKRLRDAEMRNKIFFNKLGID